jgi:hypothetical protein
MSGVELLAAAHRIDRTARRGQLIQWGDRSIAGPIRPNGISDICFRCVLERRLQD